MMTTTMVIWQVQVTLTPTPTLTLALPAFYLCVVVHSFLSLSLSLSWSFESGRSNTPRRTEPISLIHSPTSLLLWPHSPLQQ
eukprot:m.77206 g.77206  ORF g.77206 m.77206 type:complete len:82 (+) comp14684_c0_seq1:1360-1605(+)